MSISSVLKTHTQVNGVSNNRQYAFDRAIRVNGPISLHQPTNRFMEIIGDDPVWPKVMNFFFWFPRSIYSTYRTWYSSPQRSNPRNSLTDPSFPSLVSQVNRRQWTSCDSRGNAGGDFQLIREVFIGFWSFVTLSTKLITLAPETRLMAFRV